MELLALSAPWILLLLVVAAFGLLAFMRWKVAICLLLVALAGNWYFEVMSLGVQHCVSRFSLCFASHTGLPEGRDWPNGKFDSAQESRFQVSGGELKVLTFNCNLSPKHEDYLETRAGVCRLIKEQNPDVVFLAENFINKRDSVWLMLQDVYPYHSQEKKAMGNSIYSKYPILTDTIVREKGKGYGISCCQIYCRGRKVGVIGIHLSSNNYNVHMEYMTPDSVENSEQAKTYLGNIVTASRYRANEASLIVNYIDSINTPNKPIPTIVMGDFNDVCESPTLNVLNSSGLKDAWWEGGFGYGATIHHPLPYRIDHIFYNDRLKLKSIKKIDADKLSDHDALIGCFEVSK